MPRKEWWLGFPRMKCPHCGAQIEGIKFAGRWKLPRKRGGRDSGERDPAKGPEPMAGVSADPGLDHANAAADPAAPPRGERERGVTGTKGDVD